jgi:alpha/beta superfamily hydrolase
MFNRFLTLLPFLTIFSCSVSAAQSDGDMNLEQSVCGLKEPLTFWLWSRLAGKPNADRLSGLNRVEDISFETIDHRILRGYKLKATGNEGQLIAPKGYLLVMQGNAILADQLIGEFARFSSAGFDVYIYDFRGYGRSEGRRRLKAIVSDYTEIIAALNSADYEKHLIYAMSFGGIAFLNGFAQHTRLDRIIVDSTPSRLSDYGCPPAYDPVNHIPDDCSHCMFIVGQNDRVIPFPMSQELVDKAQQKSAVILRDEEFGHPFMDYDWLVHRRRMKVVEEYLLYNNKP